MKKHLLTKEYIQLKDQVSDWKEAIRIAAQPMLTHGDIASDYVEAMIETVIHLGAYIVIAPNIALPHARGDGDVYRNAISLLKLSKPVYFGDDEDSKATVILPIACVDNEKHLSMLAAIAELFEDEQAMKALLEAEDRTQYYQLFERITFEEERQ